MDLSNVKPMQSFYKISRVWDFAKPYDYRCLMQYRHTPLPGWNDNIYENYIPYIVLIVFLCNFLNSQYDVYFESGEQKIPCLIPYITIAKGRRLETRRDQGISRRYTIGDGLITSYGCRFTSGNTPFQTCAIHMAHLLTDGWYHW